MAATPSPFATVLPGGPHDVEFFLDPMCPYAWQTSVWARRVAELRDLSIGWRFISLRMVNEAADPATLRPGQLEAHAAGTRVLRVCAALRARSGGNSAVGSFYGEWGERLWYAERGGRPYREVRAELVVGADLVELLAAIGEPADLADAADDESHDALIRAETEMALDRAGDDLGTPILTFEPPDGPSYFGPVISRALSDDDSLRLYDTVTALAHLDGFSELKRSKRPSLDLPLVTG